MAVMLLTAFCDGRMAGMRRFALYTRTPRRIISACCRRWVVASPQISQPGCRQLVPLWKVIVGRPAPT